MRAPARYTRSPWRYGLILVVVCLAVVAAAAAGWRFARTSSAPSNGPIILIAIDSLRADRLPVYGYREGHTPGIDRLASDGVVFDRVYAHSPLTLPSHVSLLSGLLPFETGVRGNEGFTVKPGTALLPEMLRAAGYKSGAAVSSPVLGREAGLDRAFDFYDADIAKPDPPASWPRRGGAATLAVAQKWVASLESPRFLLFLHLADADSPDAAVLNAGLRATADSGYDARVASADAVVGDLIAWLDRRGQYDRATIAVVGAHGEALGDHGEQGHGLLVHDATIRVPLVVKLPHKVNGGRRARTVAQHIDLVPTVLDLFGMPAPESSRGRSLRAPLMGRATPVAPPLVYAESYLGRHTFGWAEITSLTDERYRYVQSTREELYNLHDDPAELRNIAAEFPDRARAMRLELEGLRPHLADAPSTALPGAVDPKDRIAAYEQYRRASILASGGRLPEAAAAYRAFLATEPRSVDGWLRLAAVLESANQFSDAVTTYRRAAQIETTNQQAWLGTTYGLLKLGKLSEAAENAGRLVAIDAGRGHELLARIAMEQNDWTAATRHAALCEQANAALPVQALVGGTRLYKSGKYEEALPLLQSAAKPVPGGEALRDVLLLVADTLSRLERYGEAETALKEEIRRFPYNVQARVSLAVLYHAQHRTTDAQFVVEDLQTHIPTPEAFAAAARIWTMFGEKDRADAARAEARLRFGREAPSSRRAR